MPSEMRETTKGILLELATVDSGEVSLPIDRELYPAESLLATSKAFAAYCETVADSVERPRALLSIHIREEHRQRSREIIGGFLNYLLHHATQIRAQPGVVR
jgi:hypothetical protein